MVAPREHDPTFRVTPETAPAGDSRRVPIYDNTKPEGIELWRMYATSRLDDADLLRCLDAIQIELENLQSHGAYHLVPIDERRFKSCQAR